MVTNIDLAAFQRWMASVVSYPGTDSEALSAPAAQKELSPTAALEFVKPSQTLTQLERLAIYRDMYVLRLIEVLETDFSTVAKFMGADEFAEFIKAYLQVHPSRSYNLNLLSDNVPAFIQTTTNLKFSKDTPKIDRRAFLYDLARLELAIAQVFVANESPVLTADAIAQIAPESWENAKLKPVSALQLLAFRYPVNAYIQAVYDEEPIPKLTRKDTYVVVYRHEYKVWRVELTQTAYSLLKDLVEGQSLGEAIAVAMGDSPRRAAALQKRVFQWFQEWIADGLFQAVELT